MSLPLAVIVLHFFSHAKEGLSLRIKLHDSSIAEQALTFQLFPLRRAARGEARNPGKGVLAQLGSGTHAPSNQLWSGYQSHVAQNECWGLSAVSVYVGGRKSPQNTCNESLFTISWIIASNYIYNHGMNSLRI